MFTVHVERHSTLTAPLTVWEFRSYGDAMEFAHAAMLSARVNSIKVYRTDPDTLMYEWRMP